MYCTWQLLENSENLDWGKPPNEIHLFYEIIRNIREVEKVQQKKLLQKNLNTGDLNAPLLYQNTTEWYKFLFSQTLHQLQPFGNVALGDTTCR